MKSTIWIHYARPRPQWYALEVDQKTKLLSSWTQAKDEAKEQGAVCTGRFHIRGQHDFETVEIWQFGSAQEVFDFWNGLCNLSYMNYFAFSNNVGAEMDSY